MRYQGIPLQRTAAEATRLLRNYQQAWLAEPPYRWVIICPSLAHNRALGIISYIIEAKNVCSIGYTLAPTYWGRGYATEALKVVMRWAFEVAKVESIENQCHPDNKASIRVLEKAGFQWDRAMQKEEEFPNLHPSEAKNVRLYTARKVVLY